MNNPLPLQELHHTNRGANPSFPKTGHRHCGRVRSIGIPPWVKIALDSWAQASGVSSGRIFRALNKDGQLAGRVKTKGGGWADGNLTPQAIYYVVEEYAKQGGYTN